MRPSWLLPLLLLPACATPPRIVATANYEVVDVATVADAVVGADVVCFGELHETPPVHRTHHELLAAIYERRPNLVIAMEMFERDVQTVLLKYLGGLLDEQSFLAQSRPWANYERDYRPVVEFAKAHNLVVLAANLPRPLASRVAKEGFAAVAGGPHVARESTAPEDDYWEWFRSTMGSHPGVTEERMRSFYAAQCAKDDTMAESITDHLKERRAAGDKPLVVFVCGRGHSDHGWGTVARIKSRMPDLDVRVLSAEMVADVDIGPMVAPKTVGDYVIASPVVAHDEPSPVAKAKPVEKGPTATKPATKPIDAKPTEAKPAVPAAQPEPAADDENLQPALGLMPDYAESGEGVKVESVRGGGAAEKAGIEAGDVIVALAGTKITDVQHYSDLLKEQKIGASITVRVRREGVEVDLQVKVGSRPRTR